MASFEALHDLSDSQRQLGVVVHLIGSARASNVEYKPAAVSESAAR